MLLCKSKKMRGRVELRFPFFFSRMYSYFFCYFTWGNIKHIIVGAAAELSAEAKKEYRSFTGSRECFFYWIALQQTCCKLIFPLFMAVELQNTFKNSEYIEGIPQTPVFLFSLPHIIASPLRPCFSLLSFRQEKLTQMS